MRFDSDKELRGESFRRLTGIKRNIGQAYGLGESAAYRNIKWCGNSLAKSKAFRLPSESRRHLRSAPQGDIGEESNAPP
jgi:hypothetical protein